MPLKEPHWKISQTKLVGHLNRQASLIVFYQAVRTNLAEARKVAAGNGSEEDKLEASIEVDVYEALQHALANK